jgi:hypothetical protein
MGEPVELLEPHRRIPAMAVGIGEKHTSLPGEADRWSRRTSMSRRRKPCVEPKKRQQENAEKGDGYEKSVPASV